MVRLRTEKLACGYGAKLVLRDVELEVGEGELLAVLGPNGAGKTTLLRTIARLLRPVSGRVLVDGADLWTIDLGRAARLVSYMPPPPPQGFNITVREFLQAMRAPFTGWAPSDGNVDRALRLLELEGFDERRVDELSSGELQRVLVASVIAREAPLMVLDEPTAHLDLKYQVRVLSVIKREAAARGGAAVISLHDARLAATFADKVALLAEGSVRAYGPPSRVLREEVLSRVYGVRILVKEDPELGFIAVPEAPERT